MAKNRAPRWADAPDRQTLYLYMLMYVYARMHT